jgi:hypothetical protein
MPSCLFTIFTLAHTSEGATIGAGASLADVKRRRLYIFYDWLEGERCDSFGVYMSVSHLLRLFPHSPHLFISSSSFSLSYPSHPPIFFLILHILLSSFLSSPSSLSSPFLPYPPHPSRHSLFLIHPILYLSFLLYLPHLPLFLIISMLSSLSSQSSFLSAPFSYFRIS